jgi:hypothetical protein
LGDSASFIGRTSFSAHSPTPSLLDIATTIGSTLAFDATTAPHRDEDADAPQTLR